LTLWLLLLLIFRCNRHTTLLVNFKTSKRTTIIISLTFTTMTVLINQALRTLILGLGDVGTIAVRRDLTTRQLCNPRSQQQLNVPENLNRRT
jgi:hypothetical protein